ncbi:MAG: coproporphyrinogen dehydrogenase HemZ [Lachnospiraceae bacterium]|nr:coproporphyrinogen dehydrogenase HemZ [Lachnospiraceae bacterium]
MSIQITSPPGEGPIRLYIDNDSFLYDVYGLLTAFYPGNRPEIMSEASDAQIVINVPEAPDRITQKNTLKKELYNELSRRQGHTLPWGTLTGVRPTKLTLRELDRGRSFEETVEYMKANYLTSEKKARLATEIAVRERQMMSSLHDGSVCLYIGIPFCPSICLYCSFSSYAIGAFGDSVEDYLDALKTEIKNASRVLNGRHIEAVYFGGGTPTSLSATQLDGLLGTLDSSIDLSGTSEFTVEAGRPDSITDDKLKVLASHGVDRISVNPQTLQQKTLDTIGRRHTVDDFCRAYSMARNYPFLINTDLIVGLPGEVENEVRDTLERIVELSPDNLTVHSLAKKRASRLTEQWDEFASGAFVYTDTIEQLVFDAARRLDMEPYYMYRQKEIAGNMENVGFARAGEECLYNVLMMEEACDIAAFGAGAVSKRISGTPAHDGMREKADRIRNPKDVKNYIDRIEETVQKKDKFFQLYSVKKTSSVI